MPTDLKEALLIIQSQRKLLAEQEKMLTRIQEHDRRSTAFGFFGAERWRNLRRRFLNRLGRELAVEILDSGLFDADYYCVQTRERKDAKEAERNPLKHYLYVGGFEGLDPSEHFDSDWYLATHPDVRAAGLNPLAHYVRFGREEARLPFAGASKWMPGEPKSATDFNARLWGGFPHVALPVLEDMADKEQNLRAAWCLAAWCYAHGDTAAAVQRVYQILMRDSHRANKRALVGLAKCFTQMEDYEGLESLLKNSDYAQALGNVYPYVRATHLSAQGAVAESLVAINDIFARAGLIGIQRADAERPFALDNVRGVVDLRQTPSSETDTPLLSVVIPTYNAGSTLHIALEGLLAQSWRNLEIIVVDDGSSDNTAQVAEAYAKKDSRVRYLPNPMNVGAYPARNNGMRAARGEFVTVHDSDDWSHPQKLERQIQPLLNDPLKAATLSSWVRVTPDLRFVGPWLLSDQYVEKNHSSLLFRRTLLDQIGYWDEVNVAGDTEFLWRLENHVDHHSVVHVLPFTPLSFALADDNSLTRTQASHVKTIHYGLRRIYREAARWWHRQAEGQPVLLECSRPFPVPLGIIRGVSLDYDLVLAGDMSVEGDELGVLLERLNKSLSECQRVCLLHWPSYSSRHRAPIADEVFAFCKAHDLFFAHHGICITAPVLRLLDGSYEGELPTQTVQVQGIQRVELADGTLCKPQAELLDYFIKGGV